LSKTSIFYLSIPGWTAADQFDRAIVRKGSLSSLSEQKNKEIFVSQRKDF